MPNDDEILSTLEDALANPSSVDDELLDQLIAAVEVLARRLHTLEASVANGGEERDQAFGKLVDIVDRLQQRTDDLETQPWKVWPEPNPTLASWVTEWLIPTFRLETVLAGWEASPAIVSELSALYGGYQMMTDPKSNDWDALTWHQHRASTIQRIEEFRSRTQSSPTAMGRWARDFDRGAPEGFGGAARSSSKFQKRVAD